jgi:hypothetical protein
MTPTPDDAMPDEIYTYHDGFQVQLTDFESDDADAFKTHVFIRRAIVTPEAAKRALDAVNHCIKTIHNESIRKEDNAIWSSGTACRPRITEDILETIRALLIAHGGGEC